TPAEFNSDRGLTVEHRWFRDGDRIDGADSSTYTLTEDDIGANITYQTHAERTDGQTVTSQVTNKIGPVLPVKLALDGQPVIEGYGYIGVELSVLPAKTNDDDNVDNTFQWTVSFDDGRDDITIDGDTFTPTEDHRGGTITVTQTATRAEDEAVVSQTSDPVGPVTDEPAEITVV